MLTIGFSTGKMRYIDHVFFVCWMPSVLIFKFCSTRCLMGFLFRDLHFPRKLPSPVGRMLWQLFHSYKLFSIKQLFNKSVPVASLLFMKLLWCLTLLSISFSQLIYARFLCCFTLNARRHLSFQELIVSLMNSLNLSEQPSKYLRVHKRLVIVWTWFYCTLCSVFPMSFIDYRLSLGYSLIL